jgi:hypothetical protein
MAADPGPHQLGLAAAAALAFIALGPALLAYRCWGSGVQQAGPNVAGFFVNLTPLFAALMSTLFLGERPHLYHAWPLPDRGRHRGVGPALNALRAPCNREAAGRWAGCGG